MGESHIPCQNYNFYLKKFYFLSQFLNVGLMIIHIQDGYKLNRFLF